MKQRILFLTLMCSLVSGALPACAEREKQTPPTISTPVTASPPSLIPPLPKEERPSDEDFKALLADYQRMNQRLERVGARIRSANKSLCPKIFRDPGFSVHALEDYAPRLRTVAQSIMGLSPNGLYIRSVRHGSPAEQADIEIGDRIVKLNGQAVPSGPTMKRFYGALSRGAFGGIKTRLTLRTQAGVNYETSLKSETTCDYPTSVFYSNEVNGHTNGEEVFITSELMRIVPDDVNLALIVAHEMSHAIAGHMEQTPSQALELEADRMALVMLDRAGYNIEDAITYWADAVHPHRDIQDNSNSHPSITARYKNFQKEQRRIRKIKTANKPLKFENE